jgi:predicted phosphodiesterase
MKKFKKQAGLWVALFDIHSPHVDWPTFNAAMDFIKKNAIRGVILGGDQNDNEEISHHNKKKFLLRVPGAFARNTDIFDKRVLRPLEGVLDKQKATKIWIEGNHDDWENQLVQENPELLGTIERRALLNLDARGWEFVSVGRIFQLGKLRVIHGEAVFGFGSLATNHSAKALLAYNSSVLYGHVHAPQSASRIAPFSQKDKHMAWCSPIVGATNPRYLREKPTAWINGFTIVEVREDGSFNVYPVIVTRGSFTFAGVKYGS